MKIIVNGTAQEIKATVLQDALTELGFEDAAVATAVNEQFVPKSARQMQTLSDGDRIEILAPQQGG